MEKDKKIIDHARALEAAYAKALAALKKKATAENVKAVTAAREHLDVYRAELDAKADPESRRFGNVLEMLGYLTDEGYKVAKTKLYADAHKIEKEKDGTYTKKAVDDYARLCLQKLDGSDSEVVSDEHKFAFFLMMGVGMGCTNPEKIERVRQELKLKRLATKKNRHELKAAEELF